MSGVVDGVNVDVSIDSKKVEEALDRMSGFFNYCQKIKERTEKSS